MSAAQDTAAYFHNLVAELQRENTRLQRLVTELLLKNQQLRVAQQAG